MEGVSEGVHGLIAFFTTVSAVKQTLEEGVLLLQSNRSPLLTYVQPFFFVYYYRV